jgi:hypothetical protein
MLNIHRLPLSVIAGLTDGEESPEGKGRGKDLSRQIGGVLGTTSFLPSFDLSFFPFGSNPSYCSRCPRRPVPALSGWLPLRTTIANHLHASAKDIPILWCHGKEDPTVPYEGKPSPLSRIRTHGIRSDPRIRSILHSRSSLGRGPPGAAWLQDS